jgi:type II secretory pathway pseudopilin PulG
MRRGEQGFTLVHVLIATALIGLGLAKVGEAWQTAAQREAEFELLERGAAIARAINSYRKQSPGSQKQWPPSLDALLLDTRFGVPMRHLRQPYGDPMRKGAAWGEIRTEAGGLLGVYSKSQDRPLRRSALSVSQIAVLPPAEQYNQWKFMPESKNE